MKDTLFYTYIMTNISNTTLYLGFTNNLNEEHKNPNSKSFSRKYITRKLVWFENTTYVNNAIKREKQIKKWNREWKNNLIAAMNPKWEDLSWML